MAALMDKRPRAYAAPEADVVVEERREKPREALLM
jgi:hypothetical protein